MKQGKASTTAELAAAMRAAEWLAPEDERVCHDPYAKYFLGTVFGAIASSRHLTRAAVWLAERIVPGFYAYFPGRVRYIDDYLETCVDDGIRQLVILGAGYDSRAYRFERLKDQARVFEVDHPSTQSMKKDKVGKAFGALPDHVVYVPVDFESQTLAGALSESGYSETLKTLFIWEGVTYYLTPDSVDTTLALVAGNSARGTSVVFDYVVQSALKGSTERKTVNRIRKIVEFLVERPMSERFVFGIEDGNIERFLSDRGFYQVTDVSAEFFESAWSRGANEDRRMLHVVHATVRPRGLS